MTCDLCHIAMDRRTSTLEEPYCYEESGLPYLKLLGIEVWRCPQCETEVPVIPRLTGLHALVARGLIYKAGQLMGGQIRFLRKFARLSAKDFAAIVDSDASTVSRWEHDEQQPNPQADKLVRVIAATALDQKEAARVALLRGEDRRAPAWEWVFKNRRWTGSPPRAGTG